MRKQLKRAKGWRYPRTPNHQLLGSLDYIVISYPELEPVAGAVNVNGVEPVLEIGVVTTGFVKPVNPANRDGLDVSVLGVSVFTTAVCTGAERKRGKQ